MLVFDKVYNHTRKERILPLTRYNVQYNSLRSNNIKSIICNKVKNVADMGNDTYRLSFDQDVLIKALLGDVHLFYIRAILQKEDVKEASSVDLTANWNIVTNYYSAFFYASLFLRLNFKGNLFLDIDLKTELEKTISLLTGNLIKLKSNQFFRILKEDDEYVLEIKKSDANTHEVVWKEMDKLLDEMLLVSRKNSDEFALLKSLKDINNKLTNTFPSKLRNRVNYQPLYGIEYIEKKLFPINNMDSWVKEIMSFDSKNDFDDCKITNLFSAYHEYLKLFSEKLIFDYYDIRGNQNGIMSKINQNRSEKIIIENIPFTYN